MYKFLIRMFKKKIYFDKLRRLIFKKLEVKKIVAKSLIVDRRIVNQNLKNKLFKQLSYYDKNSCLTKVRNICVFTGRRNGVYRFFRISRIQLRRDASSNSIYGLQKSS